MLLEKFQLPYKNIFVLLNVVFAVQGDNVIKPFRIFSDKIFNLHESNVIPDWATLSIKSSQTFLSSGGLPGDGALVQQRPVSLEQILPAEQLAVLQPHLRLCLQAQDDFSQASSFLVFADLHVHLGDGVFDPHQALHQRLVLLCVSCMKYMKSTGHYLKQLMCRII